MKFGLLKSKIEKCLVESYANNTLKRDLFVFDQLVAKNKNLNKLYYLYDELSSNKGLSESIATDFITQSITLYENTVNKISKSDISDITLWVDQINTKNSYEDIDNLFSNNVLTLESKIRSKSVILENLKKKEESQNEFKNVSINEMVSIANKTVKNYLSSLSENEKRKLDSILLESDEKLKLKYEIIKEDVLEKLEQITSQETDSEVSTKLTETINKVKSENYDKLNYFKLQELNRSL
jgi:hypothetical protein|tara:strand:- start:3456 stop:4172 length:717 start_codon:yes stop_codon:yes gene_type:complete